MKKQILILSVILGLCAAPPAGARTSVAVMPLKNEAGDSLVQWVCSVVPELFSRQLQYLGGIQAWDPAFLLPVDSSFANLESDTLLKTSRARWGWDVVAGGTCRLRGDSLFMQLKVVQFKDDRLTRKAFIRGGTSAIAVATTLLWDFLSFIGYAATPQDSARLSRPAGESSEAYNTYAAGFGYEIRRNQTAAISAYSQAVALDPKLWPACIRIAGLFTLKRDFINARVFLDKAASVDGANPLVVAHLAGFMAEHDLPAAAEAYISQRRDLLNQTAVGLKAMGAIAAAQGEYQRATAVLSRAVAAGPVNLDADLSLGRAYLAGGQFDLAIDVFDRLITYRPDFMRYYSFLGSAYRRNGRIMESIRVLETAYRINPDDIPVILNLASTYVELGWYEKAEQLLKHGKELNSTLPDIDVNLGVVYWHLGKKKEAQALLERTARSVTPRDAQAALANQANISYLSGDVDGAIRLYRKADKTGEKNEIVLYNLGMAYLKRKKLKEAVAAFEDLLRLAPNRIDVLVEQADITARLGDLKSAELYYRKILDLSPYNEDALRRLCSILEKQGQGREATSIIEAYLKNFPNDKNFRLLMADIYYRLGWFEVALMHYQNLAKDFPGFAPGFVGAGKAAFEMCVFKEGRGSDQTIFALKTAVEKDPQDAELDYMLGRVYAEFKKDAARAVEFWNRALQKAGKTPVAGKVRDAMSKAGK